MYLANELNISIAQAARRISNATGWCVNQSSATTHSDSLCQKEMRIRSTSLEPFYGDVKRRRDVSLEIFSVYVMWEEMTVRTASLSTRSI